MESPEYNKQVSKIPIIEATPLVKVKDMEIMSEGADAIVIITFANGGAPDRLAPFIKSQTQKGVPVFLLASNFGTDHGIIRRWDQTQVNLAKAGAIEIEKINVNNQQELLKAIQEEISHGKKGSELGLAVYKLFSYGENENKPIPEWER